MPYKKIEDLPDAVKKKLNPKQQKQWLNVFNSVLKKTEDEGEAAKQAWGAVKRFSLPLEIFSEGVWNGEEFTSEHLESIVDAFNNLKKEFLPKIKLGHKENQVDVALGVIDNVWKKGKKLMANISDMPKIVYDAIKEKLFQGVSVELMMDYKSTTGNKYPLALSAAALLGSELPAVKDLDSLTAYMADTKGTYLLKRTYDEKQERRSTMVDIDQKELDELRKNAAKAKTFSEKIELMEKEREEEKQAHLRKKFDEKVKDFKNFCDEKVKAGSLTPANRDLFFKKVSDKAFKDESSIEDIETLKTFVDNQVKVFDKNQRGNTTEKKTFDDPADELHTRVIEYTTEHPKVSYEDAQKLILMKDKELAKKYVNRPYEI